MVVDSFEVSNINTRIDGNTAIVIEIAHIKGPDDNAQPMDMHIRFTDTFVKRDDRRQAWATQSIVLSNQ